MKIKCILALMALTTLTGCSSIDCALDSVVVWTLTFYDSTTEEPMKLPCVLTVDAAGAGTLYNRGSNVEAMELPMSHNAEADTLYLRWAYPTNGNDQGGMSYAATDVLTIKHDNYGHFDAMDCPAAVFHTITDAQFKTHSLAAFPIAIDSVRITRPQVDYQDVENIRLYLNTSAIAVSNNSNSK